MATSLFPQQLRLSLNHLETAQFVCRQCNRHASSYRRTRKLLRVNVDPSFAPSKSETTDHIIFNPPSSAPNVYHTPSKFLPKADPRRSLFQSQNTKLPASTSSQTPLDTLSPLAAIAARKLAVTQGPLPPPLQPETVTAPKYHLTPVEIAEIRRLRAEDPKKWTRARLAEKFDCSNFFIGLCASAPEIKIAQDKRLAARKERWSRRKLEAWEDRQTRKTLWGRDA